MPSRRKPMASVHGEGTRPPRAALALLMGLGILGACADGERPPPAPEPPPRQQPDLRLVLMTDLSGYLEPCGCQSRPLGGIDRAAAQLQALSEDGVPTALMTAGDLFFPRADAAHGHGGEAPGEAAAVQQRMQAETLAAILGRMGLKAAAPGPSDLRHGGEQLAALARRGGFPLLADGLELPGGEGPHPMAAGSLALLELGEETLGVLGLSDAVEGGVSIERAQALTRALRERGAHVVVALVSSDARTARRVAGAVEGLDFIVSGGTHRARVTPPSMLGTAAVVSAGEHGHGLLVIDTYREGEGPFRDVSEWSRQAEQGAIAARIRELEGRIAEWEKDPSADATLVARQRARLSAMRKERSALQQPAAASGNRFEARWIELGPEAPADPAVSALMDAHDRRVNAHNAKAFADEKPPPAPEGTPAYVGSKRCGDCHGPAYAWWQRHAHGIAYSTLVKRDKQFNLDCVGCHVTGYRRPGGSTVTHVEHLKNVGCESCHGPGSYHAKNPKAQQAKNVRLSVPEPVCKRCHNEEHSDRFHYDTYRAMLLVPGHGEPLKEGG